MAKRRSTGKTDKTSKVKSAGTWSTREIVTASVVGVVLAFMDFSFRVRAAINKTIDIQVMLKMAVWSIALLWVATHLKKTVLPLINKVSVPWIILFAWLGATAIHSPSPALTLASGLSLILMLLLWLGAVNVLGERRLVQVMFWAMVLFCAASLVLWVTNPYLAQSSYRIHGQRILTGRLQGLTGQANALGRTAAFACLIGALYFENLKKKLGWYVLIPLAITLVTLVLTQSRTSALAFVIASVFFYALQSRRRWLMPTLAAASAMAALFIVPNFDRLAMTIARTGDPTEIYTATNRVYIWRLVATMIQERPLLGWGYNTAASYFAEYSQQVSPELGTYVPPNAHNAYLEVAFAGGLIALLFFVGAAVINLWALIQRQHQRGQALMLFWFITSFTEVAGFTAVVSTSTITMILPIALAAVAESRVVTQRVARRSDQSRRVRRKSSSSRTASTPESSAPTPATSRETSPPETRPSTPVQILEGEPPPLSVESPAKGPIEIRDIG